MARPPRTMAFVMDPPESMDIRADTTFVLMLEAQQRGHRVGAHARTIDVSHFTRVLGQTQWLDFDIMLEIKDKEKSALKALKVLKEFAAN